MRPSVRSCSPAGQRLHLRPDLSEMAAIASGTAVEGAGQGFMGLLDCLIDLSVRSWPPSTCGGRARLHSSPSLQSRPGRRRRPAARAVHRARRAPRGGQQCPLPRVDGLATGGPGAADVGLGQRARTGRARPGSQVCDAGTVLDETVSLAARIAAHPRRPPRQHFFGAGGPRDAVLEANRRSRRLSARCSCCGRERTLAEFAARPAAGT